MTSNETSQHECINLCVRLLIQEVPLVFSHAYFVLLIISDVICPPQYDEKHRLNSMVVVLKSTPMLSY